MLSNPVKAEPPFTPAMPMKTIEGTANWQGLDFRNTENFVHRLTDAEITEIDAAVRTIIKGGIDHIAIDSQNFQRAVGKTSFADS